jgi:hypothetical protein
MNIRTRNSVLCGFVLSFTSIVITRVGYSIALSNSWVVKGPGIVLVVSHERQVLAFLCTWKAVNTFNSSFPCASPLLVHVAPLYSGREPTQLLHRYLFLYHTYSIMSMTCLTNKLISESTRSEARGDSYRWHKRMHRELHWGMCHLT